MPDVSALKSIADHIDSRQDQILAAWRAAVERDPELTTANALNQSQFEDHLPEVLDSLGRALKLSGGNKSEARAQSRRDSAQHGLHRWNQGYRLRELVREWGHLHACLTLEIENAAISRPEITGTAIASAGRELGIIFHEGITESVEQFTESKESEAAGHALYLTAALKDLKDSEQNRAVNWRQAAHDLRGNVGVVKSVSELLDDPSTPEALREDVTILTRSVAALEDLLNDLLNLARLESGEEKRNTEIFDVGEMLVDLFTTAKPKAEARGLELSMQGPPSFTIEGDPAKVQRIAQNLLFNALKYTARGEVGINWKHEDEKHWSLTVWDTGPGLSSQGAPIVSQIQKATVAATAEVHPTPLDQPPIEEGKIALPPGEGIGLSIVKRLCEALDAALELKTAPNCGTHWRVLLPNKYKTPAGPHK